MFGRGFTPDLHFTADRRPAARCMYNVPRICAEVRVPPVLALEGA
jgi:hypothetical protein